ncbi:hypothetical protein KC316_g14382, partial [Hortaea werneckii]
MGNEGSKMMTSEEEAAHQSARQREARAEIEAFSEEYRPDIKADYARRAQEKRERLGREAVDEQAASTFAKKPQLIRSSKSDAVPKPGPKQSTATSEDDRPSGSTSKAPSRASSLSAVHAADATEEIAEETNALAGWEARKSRLSEVAARADNESSRLNITTKPGPDTNQASTTDNEERSQAAPIGHKRHSVFGDERRAIGSKPRKTSATSVPQSTRGPTTVEPPDWYQALKPSGGRLRGTTYESGVIAGVKDAINKAKMQKSRNDAGLRTQFETLSHYLHKAPFMQVTGQLLRDNRVLSDSLGALPADVAGLAAPVAGLAGRVGGAAIGRGAVTADVAELAAGVALHGLGLAVTSEVVGTTALVALSSAVVLDTSVAAAEATAGSTSATTDWGNRGSAWSWAVALIMLVSRSSGRRARKKCTYRNVAILAARVAAVVAGATAQAQSRAVSLNMAKALAVVAL